MKKAKKAVRLHRRWLVLGVVAAALTLPFALAAVKQPVRYTPKAYLQDSKKTIDQSPNTPPSLNGSTFAPINCQVNQECRHYFEGSDPDLYDTLSLSLDFLPNNLSLKGCQTSQTLVGNKKISCELNGLPQRQGTYKLLASLEDGTNPPVTKTFTLNVD